MGVISAPWWIAIAALLLFALLVVLRLTFDLVGQVKELASAAEQASGRLREALDEIEAESRLASQRMEQLGEAGRSRRRR